jgi:GMP synthase (glutamine-hydrolysing)
MEHPRNIIILDFGGQYAHLIASRIRRSGVYAEILPPETPAKDMKDAAGIILSGGPQSVYEFESPKADPKIFDLGIPVLGLCYGLHWMTQALGGEVKQGKVKEYGHTEIRVVDGGGSLLQDCSEKCTVWMSHGDEAATLPDGFELIATSDACKNAAFADDSRKFFALQFHPEVTHTEHGGEILKRFVDLCDAATWSIASYTEHISQQIKEEVGSRNVFMLVSGGVDSSVAFTLLNKVLGTDRVQGLLIDTGLMRKGEVSSVQKAFEDLGITNLKVENASEEFFANLKEVYDPEEKRKVIGETFLFVQKRVSEEMGLTSSEGCPSTGSGQTSQGDVWMLGQGTIYPDTIETGATAHADKIKTHHNRVEAVQKMIDEGLVIEPLKDLYKDEVRNLGEELGLPHEFVWRHPFPGPGLGVRILCAKEQDLVPSIDQIDMPHSVLPIRSVGVQGDGRSYRHALVLFSEKPDDIGHELKRLATEVPNKTSEINRVVLCKSTPVDFVFTPGYITSGRADLLREADAIVDRVMKSAGLYEKIWQFPVVLLPIGIHKGGQSIVLRPICSVDAMTADAFCLPDVVFDEMTEKIVAIDGIDLVFLDLTNKPPGTIEWE